MTDANRDIAKKEASVPEGVERTKPRRVFKPAVDIIERKDDTVLTADLPGVDEHTLDITLEKNVITIRGAVEQQLRNSLAPLEVFLLRAHIVLDLCAFFWQNNRSIYTHARRRPEHETSRSFKETANPSSGGHRSNAR